MPKVSVIIPVYNVENFLQDCIDSLMRQTLDDIEFIFVNDASTDSSLAILMENQIKNPEKIRVINSQTNMCQGGARNIGIRAASGEYIGFVDSDDYVTPCMYQLLYLSASESNADASFIQYIEVPENISAKEVLTEEYLAMSKKIPAWKQELLDKATKKLDPKDTLDLIVENLGGGVWCALWKKDLIINNDIWFPEHLRYEDNYWMSLVRCYINRISFVEEIGCVHRLNTHSTVRAKNKPYHYDKITIEKMLCEELKRRRLWERYLEAWEYIFITRYCFNNYFHFLERFDKPDLRLLKGLLYELRDAFPQWRSNRYFCLGTSKKYRILCDLIIVAPRLMSIVLKQVKKKVGK